MLSDLPTILYWYLTISLIGWLFLPLTSRIFRSFFDRGYIFSKILGILLSSYGLWLLASLKILPFTQKSIFIILIPFLALNIFLFKNKLTRQAIASQISHSFYRIFIFEELLFLGAFLFWTWIRGHEPSIHGLEKFMDFGFINAILNSRFLPPQDMWLAPFTDPRYTGGFFINYYYFGHYVTAFLTKLTGIAPQLTYNLMLATLFGLSFAATFSLGYNLMAQAPGKKRRALTAGLLTAFLVTLAGNLHTIYLFTKGYPNEKPIPFWKILKFGLNRAYWYPNATRFIPNTIHEFPSYSWVVADLHGHVLDIPFVLLAIALLLSLMLKSQIPRSSLQTNPKVAASNPPLGKQGLKIGNCRFIKNWKLKIENSLLLGLILAVLYMTNAWDGLIYLLLSSLVILASHLKSVHSVVLRFALCVLSFFLFSLPFNLNFRPFVHGIGIVGGWEMGNVLGLIKDTAPKAIKIGPFLLEKDNNLRSPLWMLAILWGFFYFNALIFIFTLFKKSQIPRSPLQTNPKVAASNPPLGKQGLKIGNLRRVDIFILLLIFLSTLLILTPEFLYAKDIYPAHYRANTMFKLGYQAFIMLSIASGYIIIHLIGNKQTPNPKQQITNKKFRIWNLFGNWKLVIGTLLTLVSIYPYFSIQSYYGVFGGRKYQGLEGMRWLAQTHPGDYEAILWLQRQAKRWGAGRQVPEATLNRKFVAGGPAAPPPETPQATPPVILEAVGDSYSDYARISANSGLPTILGWPVHEWLWRGSYDEPGRRVEEVRQIYEATAAAVARRLLSKYQVRYLVIGDLERKKYPSLNEPLLASLGKLVFSFRGTKIYLLTNN